MCRVQPQPQLQPHPHPIRRVESSSSSKPPLASWSKPRQIPMSNHVWINTERYNASLHLLSRSKSLDELARLRAEEMAKAGNIFLSTSSRSMIGSTKRMKKLKENCFKGPSIEKIHKLTMKNNGINDGAKENILSSKVKEFGMAAVKGNNNILYICQLFGDETTAW